MKRYFFFACAAHFLLAGMFIAPARLMAGFTETAPKRVLIVDESYLYSRVEKIYDNEGKLAPLIEEIERFVPGGSKQGTIIPNGSVEYRFLLNSLQYGLTDRLSLAVLIPVILETVVKPDLSWKPGDYQWTLGRAYREEDFWSWALSMEQPKPTTWEGNKNTLADIAFGFRYRFSDFFSIFDRWDMAAAVLVFGTLPTGKHSDPEEIMASGTTMWDLHGAGEYGIHLSVDKFFKDSLDDRLTLGFDFFYEIFLPQKRKSANGTKHPLLIQESPYVGEEYTLDPGDFMGGAIQVDVVAWRGAARRTWLTKGDLEKAEEFPPLLTFSLRYTHTQIGQSDWDSRSDIWDWDKEKFWRPGYKNILAGTTVISLMRLGIPCQPYVSYRNMTWLGSKNCRATDSLTIGVRVPIPL